MSRARAIVLALFAAGLACRCVVFMRPHDEGDEAIYRALAEQLDAGRGYTLQGHPLLESSSLVPDMHGTKIFFHPPGGPLLFWLFARLFGPSGFGLVEVLAWALFFFSMLALARSVLAPLTPERGALVALLAAFSPIVTHVVSRWWLDGIVLAFATASAALFLAAAAPARPRALSRGRAAGLATLAGVVLGYASLVKLTAFLVVPGVALVAWALGAPDGSFAAQDAPRAGAGDRGSSAAAAGRSSSLLVLLLIYAGVAALLQAPWEVWQWRVMGGPFPTPPGRPTPAQLATNAFVYNVTVLRSPFFYLAFLPQVLWTLVPSLLLLLWTRANSLAKEAGAGEERSSQGRTWRLGLALVAWIAVVTGVHVALGFIGFSKLLRYIILVTPATILLFALLAPAVWPGRGRGEAAKRPAPRAANALPLALLAAAGLVLEVLQGIKTPLYDDADLILPFYRK